MNSQFDKQVADLALSRGLSRASVFCALLMASGQARTPRIKPAKYDRCFNALANIPPDVPKSAAFKHLCHCPYDAVAMADDESERHKSKCLYVIWRDLIGEPLPSVLIEP
jgi:hypothetical protein